MEMVLISHSGRSILGMAFWHVCLFVVVVVVVVLLLIIIIIICSVQRINA